MANFATCLALPRDFFGGDIVGDLGIEWPEENLDRVAEIFQKMIDESQVNFYFVEKTSGLVRNKTKVTVVEHQGDIKKTIAGRKVYIKNADIKALIDEGIASIATLSGVPDFKEVGKKARTGKEAASADTVALGNRGGG